MRALSRISLCATMALGLSACVTLDDYPSSSMSINGATAQPMSMYDYRYYMDDDALPPVFSSQYYRQRYWSTCNANCLF